MITELRKQVVIETICEKSDVTLLSDGIGGMYISITVTHTCRHAHDATNIINQVCGNG